MDSVTDICKYHLLCFATIIEVKVISGHQVKKVKQKKIRDLELRYMFLGQIFTKNAKNDPKTLFEASKSVKKQNSENHGNVAKWREKCLFFTCFYVISQPFLKISTSNFVHIFMRHCPLTYVTVFWKFWFWGGNFWKRKKNVENFGNFWKFSKFWKSEIAVL